MPKFLTTSGISYQLEQIITGAKVKLVLMSPYVQINKMLLERLQQASNRGVKVILIYGKDDLKKTEKNQLATIENLKIYYYQNLHAKCYFNEKEMIITSMNLYDFSERNNREMGIFITKADNKEIFEDAVNETRSIIEAVKTKEDEKETIKETCIFPLKENDLKELQEHFNTKYKHSTINSTPTYFYCQELLPFADVMVREGFEIRMFYSLYSENLLIQKIKSIAINDLNYKYDIIIIDQSTSNAKVAFISKDASDLNKLKVDYDSIYKKIITATRFVSHKRLTM